MRELKNQLKYGHQDSTQLNNQSHLMNQTYDSN